MRRIQDTLHLHLMVMLIYSEIGRMLHIFKERGEKIRVAGAVTGVNWVQVQPFTDGELDALLYPPAVPRSSHQLALENNR